MSKNRMIVIGASAGGITALCELLTDLPADLPAPILVVIHMPGERESMLPRILTRAGPLKATHAQDGEHVQSGHIYVAPPDHHLLVNNEGVLRVSKGPVENRNRPSIDPLFRSAALAYGENAIGVILSGSLDDGTAGMRDLTRCGGIGIVQDPDDAAFPDMPRSAMEHARFRLPLDQIAPQLVELLAEATAPPAEACDTERLRKQVAIAAVDVVPGDIAPELGVPSMFACPDCGGVLWGQDDDDVTHFRCLIGHAYSPETLAAGQTAAVTTALVTALRTLEEGAKMQDHIAKRLRDRNHDRAAAPFDERREHMLRSAEVLREMLSGEHTPHANGDRPHWQPIPAVNASAVGV